MINQKLLTWYWQLRTINIIIVHVYALFSQLADIDLNTMNALLSDSSIGIVCSEAIEGHGIMFALR